MEWRSQGTLSDGEDVHYRGVSIIDIDNGLVQGFRTYYDSAVFLPTGAKKVQQRSRGDYNETASICK